MSERRPPQRIRLSYYLFEARVPPAWLDWAEADIASSSWLAREVLRLVVAFVVLTALFGRFHFSVRAGAALLVGAVAILAGRDLLRRIAIAYQRYGWDWDSSQKVPSPYLRVGLAVVFSVVFVLLTR